MTDILHGLSDDRIREEYLKRFTIVAGSALSNASAVADHMRGILGVSPFRESFAIIYLNAQHQVLDTEVLFTGSLATAAVYPRELISSIMLKHPATAAVIIAHNHPSGSDQPSRSDEAVTEKIKIALDAIDIALMDHIIIGKAIYSFSDHRKL